MNTTDIVIASKRCKVHTFYLFLPNTGMKLFHLYESPKTDVVYPVSDASNYHYSPFGGSVLMWMTPQHFIDLAPSGGPAEEWEKDPYVHKLAQHILDGFPLDAPELGGDNGHDGRHRAHAAKIAGVKKLPVYVEPDMVTVFDEGNGWNNALISDIDDGLYESANDIGFVNTSRGYHHGQTDLTLYAKIDDKYVGKIDYSVYEGEPQIQMIKVDPNYTRRGIGTDLLYHLQTLYPDQEIQWGSLTSGGAALRKKINFVTKPSEYANDFADLEQQKSSLKRLEKIIKDNWDDMAKRGEYMNQYYDLEHEVDAMQYDLQDKSPTKELMIRG